MTDYDKVWWEWYCSLFKGKDKKEIDPYTWRCVCGHQWKFSRLQLLRMFLFDDYIYTCPQCQTVMRFKLMHHVVKTETRGLKNRDRIWKNA